VRILFTFVGGTGHYEPLVPIAKAAAAAGHSITVGCRPSMLALVQADGFKVFGIGPDVADQLEVTPLLNADPEREDRILRDGFARDTARRRAKDILALCADVRPDIVVSDEVDYGALIAAEHLNLPYATVLVLASGSFARPELVADPLNEVRAEFGLRPDPDLAMLSRYLVVAPFPPSFRDPRFPLPATAYPIRHHSLEPSRGDSPRSPRPAERPTVYFTLGTIFNMESGDLFARVLAGLSDLPVNVIATTGRQLDPSLFGPPPQNIRIERFIPQADILPSCDLVISHAGSGSVIGALAHGLPSVLLPMGADQPHNADRCEKLGVAKVLDPVRVTSREIHDTVEAVLADPLFRQRARAMRDEIATLPHPSTVVPLLEKLSS